jgi:hypothetical protein
MRKRPHRYARDYLHVMKMRKTPVFTTGKIEIRTNCSIQSTQGTLRDNPSAVNTPMRIHAYIIISFSTHPSALVEPGALPAPPEPASKSKIL